MFAKQKEKPERKISINNINILVKYAGYLFFSSAKIVIF